MAAVLRAAAGLRLAGPGNGLVFTRSAFVARKNNYEHPNWFGVGLAFSTSAALWALLHAGDQGPLLLRKTQVQDAQLQRTLGLDIDRASRMW